MKIIEVPLWGANTPFACANDPVGEVPSIVAYLPDANVNTRFGMLALASGGYAFRSEWSTREYGEWFAERGVAVFDVGYRLGANGYDYRAKCADAYRALAEVRLRGDKWGVSPGRIGVIGTSAGGHLGGVMCTGAGRSRLDSAGVPGTDQVPDFGVFCYGVMTFLDPLAHVQTRGYFLADHRDDPAWQQAFSPVHNVSATHPRAFVWHTGQDRVVDVASSLDYAKALASNGVPYELHIYEKGGHALGLARREGLHWAEDCLRWIVAQE